MLKRIITGVIALVVILAGIFFLPSQQFTWVAILVVGLAAWEFAALLWKNNYLKIGVFLLAFLIIAALGEILSPNIVLFCGVVWWFLVPGLLWHYVRTRQLLFRNWSYQFGIGLIIFIPLLVGLITLRRYFGISYLLCGLTLVWAADTGAYFAGKFLGRHWLLQEVSPKKTIEGLIGGVVAAMVLAIVWGIEFKVTGIRWLFWLTLTLVVSLWSVIGDLFESVLKRCAEVKDSGTLLPGHGGIYDRIDGLTSAIPLFVFGLLFMII